MSQELDRILHRAVRTLVRRNTTLHQRLYEAAKEFPAALRRREQWPPDLLLQAKNIEKKLTAKGRLVDTICAMDTSVAADLAEEIVNLAIQIDVANRQRLDTRGHRTAPHSETRPPVEMRRRATMSPQSRPASHETSRI